MHKQSFAGVESLQTCAPHSTYVVCWILHDADQLHLAGYADRHKLTPKNINNTQYVACMNPTAGSFVVNPRLQRLFMTLAVDFPGQDSLMTIYGTFLQVCL
jgi:dynein heavy chain